MLNLGLLEGFEWDDGNIVKNAKHGVSPSEAEQVFANSPLLLLDDQRHSQEEERFHAYGRTDKNRLLQVAFTLRNGGRLVRVISARDMSRKERQRYDEEV